LNLFSSFLNNIFAGINKIIRKKVDEIIRQIIKVVALTIVGTSIVLLGVFHLSTGFIKYFSTIFGNEAIAYGTVGVFLLLLGMILLLVIPKQQKLTT